jgi:hypothetical protein
LKNNYEQMNSVILLSGPPGAGKSTIAKELVAGSAGPTVCIEGDKFWSFFVKGAPGHGRTKVFRSMLWSMVAAAMPCAKGGYETIVDFSVPLWFIDPLRTRFPDMAFDYIVIRPTAAICAARFASRRTDSAALSSAPSPTAAEGAITDYSPYLDFYADFDVAKANLIADDSSDPAAIATLIREGLEAGRFRLAPPL